MNEKIQQLIDEGRAEIEREIKQQEENTRIEAERRQAEQAKTKQEILAAARLLVPSELHEYLTASPIARMDWQSFRPLVPSELHEYLTVNSSQPCWANVYITIPGLAPVSFSLSRNGANYLWTMHDGFTVPCVREIDELDCEHLGSLKCPDPRYRVVYRYQEDDWGYKDIRHALVEAQENAEAFARMTADAERKNEEYRAQVKHEAEERAQQLAVQERTGEVDQAVDGAERMSFVPEPTRQEIFIDALRELVDELVQETHANLCANCE